MRIEVRDTRQTGKVAYPLPDCYISAFAIFFLQDPSLLEIQRRFQDQIQQNTPSTVFGVGEIPAITSFARSSTLTNSQQSPTCIDDGLPNYNFRRSWNATKR
jgi:hypothetical protein